jgi:RNA polymerase sigma-70 factor (ECF subfamily)
MMSRPPLQPELGQVARVQMLFVQHAPALRGFVLALLPDFTGVDDVVQETFLTVTAKATEFEPGSNFLRWASTIARFKILEWVRKNRAVARPLSEEVLDALCACEPPAEEAADQRLQLLADCVNDLAPQARRAVQLRYQHAHKPAEVARLMGWSVASVYVALARARAALRDCVNRRLAEQGT